MAATPEAKTKAKVKAWLKARGAFFFMPVSNGMGRHGVPDVICCWNGRFIGIECKAPGKLANVSPLQEECMKEIRTAGGIAMVVDDVAQLAILEELMNEERRLAQLQGES